VLWGGVPLLDVPAARVRERVLVADNEADLFAGTLREVVAGAREHGDEEMAAAVEAAMAQDVVDALPDGLDSPIDAQGRNLSGGQRQRVRLVRALLADPEVLLAVEPTSALDAHTEAAVAARLRTAREGRTTLVAGTSPLLLDQADTVYYLRDGKVAAKGPHRALLREVPGYRALVARETEEAPPDTPGDTAPGGPAGHGSGTTAPEGTPRETPPSDAAAPDHATAPPAGAAGVAPREDAPIGTLSDEAAGPGTVPRDDPPLLPDQSTADSPRGAAR
jgi:ABC-type multidrug transport system ATPase subunit